MPFPVDPTYVPDAEEKLSTPFPSVFKGKMLRDHGGSVDAAGDTWWLRSRPDVCRGLAEEGKSEESCMFVIPDEIRSPINDHLRVTDKMLGLIHRLSRGPASCDHQLIGGYALQAHAHLDAAVRLLNEREQEGGGGT